MVVYDYDGIDVNVVIPNYVGAIPVIGIDSGAFKNNTSIKTVSFSKNTIWIEDGAFSGCSNLESVDFNGAKLTEIPDGAFEGTALKSIVLPDTVKKLGNEAFDGSDLVSINYENIIYFGDYSLQDTRMGCVYLGDHVIYVGSNAFNNTFVYVEHETLPSLWASNISGSSSMYAPIVNAKKSGDYIYSISNGCAVINRYIGEEKKISIPSEIDGFTVTEIGHGFDSYSEELLEAENGSYFEVALKEVIIPESVTKINGYTFLYSRSFIYVPASVETVELGLDDDYYMLAFYAFESAECPFEYGDFMRIATGIDYSNVVYDEESELYLYEDSLGYSVLASHIRFDGEMTIPAWYGEKPIHTIKSWAIGNEDTTVKISSGITKIQRYAIYGYPSAVYIPASVTTINAYGVVNADYYFIEAKTKPAEWDTYWNGNDSTGVYFGFGHDGILFDAKSKTLYKLEDEKATLVKYVGTDSTLYIPREVNGYTVTKIGSNFYASSGRSYIYVPKEIEVIETTAFKNSSYSTFYFYFEASEQPSEWAFDWYYSSYYGTTTNYVTKYWNQSFSY